MVSLEQVKLLESQVIKTIDYVDKVTEENNLLRGKLESYQKRIDELEVLVQRFKEDQNRIEEGILSALNRLNQFEADMKTSLAPEKFRTETAPLKTARTEEENLPDLLQEKKDEDQPLEHAFTGEPFLPEAEEEADDGLILEPETDDLPGDEEASDETLNPGELDIF
jgi:chromosome segregation ATPase